ncbi:MAG: hypothetical protein ACR5K9_08590 [Wolbachia sp.]
MDRTNTPFFIAGAIASLTLLTSGVFALAPYVAFLSSVAALEVALPVVLTVSILSAIVIALSCKIISQNEKFDVKEIELDEKARLAKEQKNRIENLKIEVKELNETKQKIGKEKDILAQNIGKLKDEESRLALKNKKLETQIKKLNDENQELKIQLSERNLGLTNAKQGLENLSSTQTQKNDSCYSSGASTPTTSQGSLSIESTVNGAARRLGSYNENQERQTTATPEGQRTKRLIHDDGLGSKEVSDEEDSATAIEHKDTTDSVFSNSKKRITDKSTLLLNFMLNPEMKPCVMDVLKSISRWITHDCRIIAQEQKIFPNFMGRDGREKRILFLGRISEFVTQIQEDLCQLNAQIANDSSVLPMSSNRSSSLSSLRSSNNGQPGPSCKLDKVQPVLRDCSLHSDNSGISSSQNH